MAGEKRNRTRVPVHFDATVVVGEETVSLETENISLSGMLCGPDERIKAGKTVDIRIALSPEAVIKANARIARSDDKGIAIAFAGIDEDGFFHLKHLVQYNADDADLIDRELVKADS